jgi:hypothetical protein
MSLFGRSFVGIVGAGILAVCACEARKQTELVAGVSTQVQVPRDLRTVRVDVTVGGSLVHCSPYKVYDGRVQLPKTLGTIPASASGQRVSITVTGFTTDTAEEVTDCGRQVQVSKENARILRRSIQTYSPDKILFVPMPLKYACYDVDCSTGGSDSTCKAGRCVDANVPVESLAEYDDKLVFGDSASCFRALRDTVNGAEVPGCVDPASPVETVDATKCIYKLPDAAPGTGLNVVAVYDGGFLEEILDVDKDEGFTVPDPAKPREFQLAPGLCELARGVDEQGKPTTSQRSITGLKASATCAPKLPTQPICNKDVNKITTGNAEGNVSPGPNVQCGLINLTKTPAETSILLVVQKDTNNEDFFKGVTDDPLLPSVKVGLAYALTNPALSTANVALSYTPEGTVSAACGAGLGFAVPFKIAPEAQPLIEKSIADGLALLPDVKTPGYSPRESVALNAAYTTVGGQTAFRKGVVYIGNSFDGAPCGPEVPAGVKRYALVTGGLSEVVVNAATVKAASIFGADRTFNVTSSANSQKAIQKIISEMGTCAYKVDPANPPLETDKVRFYNPLTTQSREMSFAAGCNGENGTGEGWGLSADQKYLFVCGNACNESGTGLRDVLATSAALAYSKKQTPPAVPLFASRKCGK